MENEMLTAASAALKLNGNEYLNEGSKELFEAMGLSGLVAVFGASDDLMEFRGAIDDEIGAYDGTTAYLNCEGLLKNECDNDDCKYFKREKDSASKIKAIWDDGGYSWRYQTRIPHVKFVIVEDGEPYCEGIVFDLNAA